MPNTDKTNPIIAPANCADHFSEEDSRIRNIPSANCADHFSEEDARIWKQLYEAAKSVQKERMISDYVTAGEVSAAILSSSGKIYTGVCIDTCSTLGICAERNAIFNMITNGEQEIRKVLAILPDGKTGAPCGACRELMVQLMPGTYSSIEIMLDYENEKVITLGELTPEWWIK
ncbi:MAG: cytidine deaminase [Lachnospiraceae bacterium]|nr:cytidine deaminase [Lachnospiraceae bacterium]